MQNYLNVQKAVGNFRDGLLYVKWNYKVYVDILVLCRYGLLTSFKG